MEILKFVCAIGICLLAGAIGSFFTAAAIPDWFATLIMPALSPPNWVFGSVWTALYILMGTAAFLVWRRGLGRRDVRFALTVFALQLVLNTLWSVIFFGLRSPGAALIEIILLWLSILWTIVLFSRITKPAAWLLAPYLLWVSFAVYLNYAIWVLN